MAFADHQAPEPSRGGRGALIPGYLASMPESEREAALRHLHSLATNEWVASVFTKEGYPLAQGTVRKWRIVNNAGPYKAATA